MTLLGRKQGAPPHFLLIWRPQRLDPTTFGPWFHRCLLSSAAVWKRSLFSVRLGVGSGRDATLDDAIFRKPWEWD